MEELYKSVIPNGNIHCLDWSVLNLLAVSVSINKKDLVGEGFGSSRTHQLLVLDANRPWEYHCVYGDSKSFTKVCKWSPNGRGLLSVEYDGVARVWKMKDKCINSWQRAHKIELEEKLLHAGWVEYPQLPNIDFSKKPWPERYECPPHSSYLHMMCPHSLIFVFSSGKVMLVSFHGSESVVYSVNLDVEGSLVAVKTISASNGSILCVVCCADGLIKLFTLNIEPSSGQTCCISSTLSTSFHPTGGTGGLMTDLVMHPQMGGCSLHICYDDTNLLLWSIRRHFDGTYNVKKETLEIMQHPVTSICCTTICQCISDAGLDSLVATPAGGVGEFLLEVEREDRRKWPVELIVMAQRDGSTIILNRNTYQVLYSGKILKDSSDSLPATKRARYDGDRSSNASPLSICVSPNGCCVAFTSNDTITVSSLSPFILGEKGFKAPEVSRWNVLLALAAIKGNSVWDIAAMCSRVAFHSKDSSMIDNVLTHWTEDFMSHADHMNNHLMHQYYTTCATLHSCLEEGLVSSLDLRDVARLHGISSLLFLSFPTAMNHEATPIQLIKDCCASGDPSIENAAKLVTVKDLVIPQELSSKLQSHAHWIIEVSIKHAARVFSAQTDRIPDRFTLEVLQQCLLLIYIWNKSQSRPLVNVADASIGLLYKVFTLKLKNSTFDESLRNELSKSLPTGTTGEDYSLTLTRASYLQGFLNGLSTTRDLPETFYRDRFPCLRPHVQSHYSASDPYSPLGLAVPKGLVPPWRDVFVDGHYDIIRGCVLMKSVLQKSRVIAVSVLIMAVVGCGLYPIVVATIRFLSTLFIQAPPTNGKKAGLVTVYVGGHGHTIRLDKKLLATFNSSILFL